MTLTLSNLNKIITGRPIVNRPGHPVIIPADVRSVRDHCRIMVLKVSCNKEQQNIDASRKEIAAFAKQEFLAIVLVLANACMYLAWCLLYGPIIKT